MSEFSLDDTEAAELLASLGEAQQVLMKHAEVSLTVTNTVDVKKVPNGTLDGSFDLSVVINGVAEAGKFEPICWREPENRELAGNFLGIHLVMSPENLAKLLPVFFEAISRPTGLNWKLNSELN